VKWEVFKILKVVSGLLESNNNTKFIFTNNNNGFIISLVMSFSIFYVQVCLPKFCDKTFFHVLQIVSQDKEYCFAKVFILIFFNKLVYFGTKFVIDWLIGFYCAVWGLQNTKGCTRVIRINKKIIISNLFFINLAMVYISMVMTLSIFFVQVCLPQCRWVYISRTCSMNGYQDRGC